MPHTPGARWLRPAGHRALVATGLIGLALALSAAPTAAAPPAPADQPDLAAGATPAVTERVAAAKAPSSRLAKSDPSVLQATGTERTPVVVKLDYDSLAAYRGHLSDYAATSPAVTGNRVDRSSDTVRRYEAFIAQIEDRFTTALAQAVPEARVGTRLRTVFGGIAVTLPANRAKDLLALPGVVAVQADDLVQPLTDSSPEFIGAPTLYDALDTDATAGEGIVVGVIDTGGWPEHPSYQDPGIAAPPPRADGEARTCDFGDNPLTEAEDVFVCNDKLIAGEAFLDTYNSLFPDSEVYDSARDSDGHGTHTSTTAAGSTVAGVEVLGVDRGTIHGIAPGAHIAVYKGLGTNGGFSSDLAAAVAETVEDGVDVINYSISGGSDPYSDPVELAFLDAYAAGVLASTSAGNDGPGAGTVNHLSPWVATVAASTQERAFKSTLTVTADGETFTDVGASITDGVEEPAPVVMAGEVEGYDALCSTPAPEGMFTGAIVACERGVVARVAKGYNVMQGGAVGMILYNPVLADSNTDNHWLPTVHLPDGTAFLAFMAEHPDAMASFTAGQKEEGQGDVMAAFSSRGPGGEFLKPDMTAPGVQILAGHTPTPESTDAGPPGELYQAIAGTSMSAPHVAGAAALLLALHPDWGPGQVKSALMTTATTSVVKEDTETPADPFDMGSGRIDLNRAGDPGLTFNESAEAFAASADDTLSRLDLNVPSVNATVVPGVVSTTRVATNVTDTALTYTATATAPAGATIAVSPSEFTVEPGASVRFEITIKAVGLEDGQYFGEVQLDNVDGDRDLHLPVAFNPGEGAVSLSTECVPDSIAVIGTERATCTVEATNTGRTATEADLRSVVTPNMVITSTNGATKTSPFSVVLEDQALGGEAPGVPSIAPAGTSGYLPLASFGIAPISIGDEEALNFGVPAFTYAGETYDSIGVVSNGYAVVGGAESGDVTYVPQDLPNPAQPNNVLAPYWTDLDGTEAPGVYVGTLTDGVNSWLVVEWQVNLFGTEDLKVAQLWIGLNGEEDITYTYDQTNLPGDPGDAYGLTVGAENLDGSGGDEVEGAPTEDLRVTSTEGTPGGIASYQFTVRGLLPGNGKVTTKLVSPAVEGVTVDVEPLTVTWR